MENQDNSDCSSQYSSSPTHDSNFENLGGCCYLDQGKTLKSELPKKGTSLNIAHIQQELETLRLETPLSPGELGSPILVSPKRLPLIRRPEQIPDEFNVELSSNNVVKEPLYLDLPELPPMTPIRPHFFLENVTEADLDNVAEPWALSALHLWLQQITYGTDATVAAATGALAKLFIYRISALTWVIAESLASRAMTSLQQQTAVISDSLVDPWEDKSELLLTDVVPCGVLPLLCGFGCYSSSMDCLGCCYSITCCRESRPPITLEQDEPVTEKTGSCSSGVAMDWAKYWHLSEADLAEIDKKAIKRQYAVHELIMSEVAYVRDLNIYLEVFSPLQEMIPQIIDEQDRFCEQVFGKLRKIILVNAPLCHAMRTRQATQGPYISSIADLLVAWARDAADAYLQYAEGYVWAETHLRNQMATKPSFAEWMKEKLKDERLQGAPHSFYFSRTIPRLARYNLLLGAIQKLVPEGAPEWQMLARAMSACSDLTKKCDEQVASQQRLIDIQNLRVHMVFKRAELAVDLGLDSSRRRLIKSGDVVRRGNYNLEWVPTHLLLLDNFLVVSKLREGQNGTAYYVTKAPIPLELLALEAADADPVVKRLAFTSGAMTTSKSAIESTPLLGNAPTTTIIEQKEMLFPFRVNYLGHEQYTFFASSAMERQSWANAIVEAQSARADFALAQQSEPFSIKVLASCFGFETHAATRVLTPIPRTLLEIASREPIDVLKWRSRVNTMTYVADSEGGSSGIYFAGLDYGLWALIDDDWVRALDVSSVTSLHVSDSFDMLLLTSERRLYYYKLSAVVAHAKTVRYQQKGVAPQGREISRKKVGQVSLVNYDRMLVTFVQQEAFSTSVQFVEPVRQVGCKSGMEYFRDYDSVSGTDATGMNLFRNSLIAHTSHAFEYIDLANKIPCVIPQSLFNGQRKEVNTGVLGRPVEAFRVSRSLILLVYERGCLLCDNKGQLVPAPMIHFQVPCSSANFLAPFLLLVSDELIEIRRIDVDTNDARLRKLLLCQVIVAKRIRLLSRAADHLWFSMAHPRKADRQLVIELNLNHNYRPSNELAAL